MSSDKPAASLTKDISAMKNVLVLTTLIFWSMVGSAQTSASSEEDWIPLEDDFSREELLRLHMPLDFGIESVLRDFKFPQDSYSKSSPGVYGIDISHYTPSNLPLSQLRSQNIGYVYAKATQGTTFKDSKFGYFWKNLGSLPSSQKVLRGAYHFLSSSSDPVKQAERYVDYVNLQGGFRRDDLPPVMDLEWDVVNGSRDLWKHKSPTQIVNAALAFLNRVEQLTGRTPMLYTVRSWWRERQIPESEIAKFSRYLLWIADYSNATLDNENPRGPGNVLPDLWQFTDRSRLSVYPSARLDANVFRGTENEFLRTFLSN
jgi:lysozyme